MKCEHGTMPWWDCRRCAPCDGTVSYGDDPIEPYFDEHISAEGAYITSRGQRRALMSKAHLDYYDVSKKKRGRVYVCLGGK